MMQAMSYCVLLDLPADIIVLILSELLSIDDIGILDCALTQHSVRNQWLEQLRDKQTLILNTQGQKKRLEQMKFINWMTKRKLLISELKLDYSMFDTRGKFTIKTDLKSIEKINATRCPNVNVVNRCIKLKSLIIDSRFLEKGIKANIWRSLTSLEICDSWGHTIDTKIPCVNLINLTLKIDVDEKVLIALLKSNPNVQYVEVIGTKKAFETIMMHCPHMKSLHFRRCYCYEFADILTKYPHWLKFETFYVGHFFDYFRYKINNKNEKHLVVHGSFKHGDDYAEVWNMIGVVHDLYLCFFVRSDELNLEFIQQSFHCLQVVNISCYSPIEVLNLLLQCPNLIKLIVRNDLQHCDVLNILKNAKSIQLQDLWLSLSFGTEELLLNAFKSFPNLNKLTFNNGVYLYSAIDFDNTISEERIIEELENTISEIRNKRVKITNGSTCQVIVI